MMRRKLHYALSSSMYDLCEVYILAETEVEKREAFQKTRDNLLEIDANRHQLEGLVSYVHAELMEKLSSASHSNKLRDVFMESTLSKCCAYKF